MFRSRPSSGSLQLSLAKVILILRHSVKLLFGGMAACPIVTCVLYAVQSGTESRHVTLGHVATPQNNNFPECFNINITLARLKRKHPGRRPKHVGAVCVTYNSNNIMSLIHSLRCDMSIIPYSPHCEDLGSRRKIRV